MHPMLVHFPIALFLFRVLFQVIAFFLGKRKVLYSKHLLLTF
ncbi:DUF2231 domain-containing protein [Bacillus carboniphilus]